MSKTIGSIFLTIVLVVGASSSAKSQQLNCKAAAVSRALALAEKLTDHSQTCVPGEVLPIQPNFEYKVLVVCGSGELRKYKFEVETQPTQTHPGCAAYRISLIP